jgi:hypothetical protein
MVLSQRTEFKYKLSLTSLSAQNENEDESPGTPHLRVYAFIPGKEIRKKVKIPGSKILPFKSS